MSGQIAIAGPETPDAAPPVTGLSDGPYQILRRIPLDGAATVSALAPDSAGTRVYAAVGNEIRAFDTRTGKADAAATLPAPVIALAGNASGNDVLYAAIGAPARLVILQSNPLRVVGTMPLPFGVPSALMYDDSNGSLYVESASDHVIARIDPTQRKVVAIAKLSGALGQMTANGRGSLYVTNSTENALDVIDMASMRVVGSIPLPRCVAPTGVAMDPVGRRLFVACGNDQALVVDEDMGFIFVRVPITHGKSLHTAFAFHPFGPDGWKGAAFITGDSDTLDAVQMKAFVSYEGAPHVALPGSGTAMAVLPAMRQLWLATAPGSQKSSNGAQILVLGAKQ